MIGPPVHESITGPVIFAFAKHVWIYTACGDAQPTARRSYRVYGRNVESDADDVDRSLHRHRSSVTNRPIGEQFPSRLGRTDRTWRPASEAHGVVRVGVRERDGGCRKALTRRSQSAPQSIITRALSRSMITELCPSVGGSARQSRPAYPRTSRPQLA